MISKPLEAITKDDIDALIREKEPEWRTMEYKESLPGSAPQQKNKFLAQVSSFANAVGGDLIYGIIESEGTPRRAIGCKCNPDQEIPRLEQMIRHGISPRIPGLFIRAIIGFEEGPVLVIRIPRSWASPHIIKENSRFYTRGSNGKVFMDLQELRAAFSGSEALPEKIRRFRDDRLARIIADETPVPLRKKARMILHIAPAVSFTTNFRVDVSTLGEKAIHLRPIGGNGGNHRFNLDGFVTYDGDRTGAGSLSYCQIFRAGRIESVSADLVSERESVRQIASVIYEYEVIEAMMKYLPLLKILDIPCPLSIMLSMVGVAGALLAVSHSHNHVPIDRDTLILPDILIEDYSAVSDEKQVAKELRPAFDAVWNACGFPYSFNFDKSGEWNPQT